MAKKGALVTLRHKTKRYNGTDYESFTGTLKVGSKNLLLSINADGGLPKVVEGEYKEQETRTIFVNVHEFNPNQTKKRKNEL